MRQETINVYKFDELSESAKETARDWYREVAFEFDWWDSVYDDFEQICKIIGVDLKRHGNGVAVFFSGFAHQGQGAYFEGVYTYQPGAHKKIREYAPVDTELHGIVDALKDAQRKAFYQLYAECSGNDRSNIQHVKVLHEEGWWRDVPAELEDAVTEALTDLAHWLYKTLEAEFDYLNSDESVDESICINEYEFEEDGSIH